MWKLIDSDMNLRACSVYCYSPEEDPFDGEDAAIWSLAYFFFNKTRKRVCYLYLRGLNAMSHSPVLHPSAPIKREASSLEDTVNDGASKRARYWLGDRAKHISGSWADDDNDIRTFDDEVDADDDDWDIRDVIEDGYATDYDYEDESDYAISRDTTPVMASASLACSRS